MSYSAPNRLLMPARHSIDTMGDMPLHIVSAPSARTWPTANLAIYVPVLVRSTVVVRKLWYACDYAGVGTENVDLALYDAAGVAVVSATAAAGANNVTEQVFDVTDTTIAPGLYYMGMSSDATTFYVLSWAPSAPICAAVGILTEAAAYPLPSTATMASNQTLARIPVMGMLVEATVA